jgi:acyl-CoA thioester hydrolase
MDTAVTDRFREHLPGYPNTSTIPVAAETFFTFHRPITHPAQVETGFRVNRLGNSSVISGVGIFLRGELEAAAWGHIVHVWVDRATNKPVPIPEPVRRGLLSALVEGIPSSKP